MTQATRTKRGKCSRCFLPTGNLDTHEAHCHVPTAQAEDDPIVIRAGAHAASARTLAEPARFQHGVTDLYVARLMVALEQGRAITLQDTLGWRMEGGSTLPEGWLTRIIREAVRTGLARVTDTGLRGAEVHARSSMLPIWPACMVSDMGAVFPDAAETRYRLVGGQWISLVDCEACLGVPISRVAYSNDE